jgi:RND superfamily putative drug exporter
MMGGAISNESGFIRDSPDSEIAANLIEQRLTGPKQGFDEIVIVKAGQLTVDDQAFQDKVNSLYTKISEAGAKVVDGSPVVAKAVNFYSTKDPSMVSQDRHTTMGIVTMAGTIDDAVRNLPPIQEIVNGANETDVFDTYLVGSASFSTQVNEIAGRDLARGEGIGLIAAIVVLILVFGALAAAPIPILLAVVTIIVSLAATSILGQVHAVSFFIINMITMIGLAVGVDYSLFIVSRYRDELANGVDKMDAIAKAGATASRAVFFSGIMVVLALLGMLIVPANIYFSLGLGAILAAIVAVVAALTLLPAILSIMGNRVNAWRIPIIGAAHRDGRGGLWERMTRLVMAHPIFGLVVSAGIMIALATPVVDLKTGMAGVETFSNKYRVVQGYDLLIKDFSSGLVATTDIVVDAINVNSPEVQAGVKRFQDLLASDPIFSPTKLVVNKDGNLGLLSLSVNAPTNEVGFEKVREIRNKLVPAAMIAAKVYVGGGAASSVDFISLGDTWMPRVLIFTLCMSFLLLTAVFRSLVVPIKAILMNLLSVGATYGLMALVFIKGFGTDTLRFTKVDTIDSWIPLFLFAVLFGLSMDYHVILISRIRERFVQTRNNEESVAYGLRTTASMITGAAIIMVAVFLGFALAESAMFQQVGFGLAVAVFLDATIVRSVLVPSSMKLLGDRNWYLPGFLNWLPTVGSEVK